MGNPTGSPRDLPIFSKVKPEDRKAVLENNRRFAKHGSMVCILINDRIIGFASIHRDEDPLSKKPPIFVVQLEGAASTVGVLTRLKTANNVKMVHIDTAIFAYKPVLKAIQDIRDVPLAEELLFWEKNSPTRPPSFDEPDIVAALKADPGCELQSFLRTPTSIKLDEKQAASLVSGLTQKVSLIQGPPGELEPIDQFLASLSVWMGRDRKSFVGALLAKILVCCYTNHALDQFLEDLMKIGIPPSNIVRLGGKATVATKPLQLNTQEVNYMMTHAEAVAIGKVKNLREQNCAQRQETFDAYRSANVHTPLPEYLESEDPEYFAAFQVPKAVNGHKFVGRDGKPVHESYLLTQWVGGRNAGFLSSRENAAKRSKIWSMPPKERQETLKMWKDALSKDQVHVYDNGEAYHSCFASIERMQGRKIEVVLKEKRTIACTTTGAAKYGERIRAASPTVILVEEAGEILESHVLAALLILLGDHKLAFLRLPREATHTRNQFVKIVCMMELSGNVH